MIDIGAAATLADSCAAAGIMKAVAQADAVGDGRTAKEDCLILKTFLLLILASALEVGGDALIRMGLRGAPYSIAAGAATLFAYGVVVNKNSLDFNRLMGAYIAIFFVVSQIISLLIFKEIPDDRLLLGGGFIIAGGLLIMLMT